MSYFLDFSIFHRNRNFALLYIGQTVSFFGSMITRVVIPYQVYILTRSTLMVGLISLFQLIPLIFTALIGGVFADRYHRRRLLIVAEFVLAIGSLLLAINAAESSPSLLLIFILATIMSGFNGLHRPALESIVQQIVIKSDLATVSSLKMFRNSTGMIIGPAIGGILLASYGVVFTYLTDVFSFGISLVSLALIKGIVKPLNQADDTTLGALKKGLQYAMSRQELMGSYIVDFLAMVFGMPIALFPAIAVSYGTPRVLGLLYSSLAIGALTVSLFSGWMLQINAYGKAIAISAIFWGIAIIFFGFTIQINLYLGLLFLFIAGGFDAVSTIFRTTLWNETIPTAYRGRLAGIEMISYLSGPRLGDTEAGLAAAIIGITGSIVSGGILCVLSVGICCYYLPKFWRYHVNKA